MKKYLIALAMLLTLSTATTAVAQKHRHNPAITARVTGQTPAKADSTVLSTNNTNDESVVAYSDTTSVDTATTDEEEIYVTTDISEDDELFSFLDRLTGIFGGAFGGFIASLVVILVFLLLVSPFLVIGLIVWLLARNRNRKYKLAEKAMETGQQVPQELLKTEQQSGGYLWRAGIKHAALGLGLVAFFYCLGADALAGIGWLMAFYGVGQAFIGYRDRNKKDDDDFEVEK